MTDQFTCRIRWEDIAELDGKPLQVVCRSRPADLVEWLRIFLNLSQSCSIF